MNEAEIGWREMAFEQRGAEIGQHNYAHWTGKPIRPGRHEIAFVPQTIADGWDAFCSCGEWRGFVSFYDEPDREAVFERLTKMHKEHAAGQGHE